MSDTACITYEMARAIDGTTMDTLSGLELQRRTDLVVAIHHRSELALCGAGTARCTGAAR